MPPASRQSTNPTLPLPRRHAALLAIFATAIAALAYREFQVQREALEIEMRAHLSAIADMNARQILEWRQERAGDARSLMADHVKLDLLRRVIDGSAPGARKADLQHWMEEVCHELRYVNAVVTDLDGHIVQFAGQHVDSEDQLRPIARRAVADGTLIYQDIAVNPANRGIHQYLGIALRNDRKSPVFGSVLLTIDPKSYLFALLESWAGPSASAETLLVRVEDKEVVVLNPTRNQAYGPLGLRVPLDSKDSPIVKAVHGARNEIEGVDYRGARVYAAARAIPNMHWFVVAKIDREEVLAPLRRRSVLLAVAAASLILAAALGLVGYWRRRQATFYRAELEQHAIRGHLESLSLYGNDSILLLDSGGSIVEANDQTTNTYGYSLEELRQMTVRDLRKPDQETEFEDRWREVESLGSRIFESVHVRKDGREFPIEVSARVLTVDGNIFVQTIHRDISERKKAERERSELELRLQQAQKMETIGRLAGGVAHDFNNHLTVINGYCELLIRQFGDEPAARRRLEEIRAAGKCAAALSGQLLTFSRKQLVLPRRISLNRLVTESTDMLARLIGDDVAIVPKLEPDTYSVMADAVQIKQVLMNLTVNARDAMPIGGVVTIQTRNVEIGEEAAAHGPEARPGPYVLLSVTDTGSGMSPETMQKIFDPFFTTKPKLGTGLGLATAYGIVRQAGGWIEVESQLGQGSTFRIYLPGISGEPEPVLQSAPPEASLRGSETVLVVEDHADIRSLMISILEEHGYHLLEAPDGMQALELAGRRAESIDLLLSDVSMPGMSGPQLARRLHETRPGLKVMYVSGYPSDNTGRQPLLEPGVPYLQKPFSPVDLAAKVRAVLDEGRAKRTVMIADDDSGVRAFLRDTLQEAGYGVAEAPDAMECLRELTNCHADLVITDMVMPGMEGLDLVRQLGREHPELPVVLMSGASHQGLIRAALHLGGRAVLTKPIQAEELLNLVRRILPN